MPCSHRSHASLRWCWRCPAARTRPHCSGSRRVGVNGSKRAPKLIAVTIDHALRKESAREALAVKRLATKLKVEHRTLRWTGAKPKTGIQEAARNARYRLLAVAARKAGAEHILTAHTHDDQAETVLFRLMRGSGLSGLRGMALESPLSPDLADKAKLVIARPLLAVAQIPAARDPRGRKNPLRRPIPRTATRASPGLGCAS